MADFGLLNQPQNFFASAQNAFLAGQQQAQHKRTVNALAANASDPQNLPNALLQAGDPQAAIQAQTFNANASNQRLADEQHGAQIAAQQRKNAVLQKIQGADIQGAYEAAAGDPEAMKIVDAAGQHIRDTSTKIAQIGEGLKAIPDDAQRQAVFESMKPGLIQAGYDEKVIDGFVPTHENIDAVIAQNTSLADQFARHKPVVVQAGATALDQSTGKPMYTAPAKAPNAYMSEPDGSLAYRPGGPADPVQAAKLAAARRKPGGATGGAGAGVAGPVVSGPHAVGGMSADSIENLATRYNTGDSTVLTGLGMGKAGVAMKTAILNRAAELAKGTDATDVMGNRASTKAAVGALAALTKARGNIEQFEGTANLNAELTLQAAKDANLSGQIPVVNAWLRSGRKNIAGDPNVARFELAIGTLADEYAKVVSGGGGNQGATVAAQQEAERRLSRASTPEQLTALVGQMKKEMASRSTSMRAQEASLRAQAAGHPPAEPSKELNGLSPAQHSAAAQFIGHGAQPGSQGNPYTPRSMAEFKGLKPGQWFIDDDGSVHQKGAK